MPRLRTFRLVVTSLGFVGSTLPGNPLAAQAGHRIRACAVREAAAGQPLPANPTLPVMFTAVRDGQVVRQSETKFPADLYEACAELKDLGPGSYDIRVEAAGMRTEVKRGARLFADQDSNLSFVLNPGSGIRIVEYAHGGLGREEVAMRLVALESALAKIRSEAGAPSPAAKAAASKP